MTIDVGTLSIVYYPNDILRQKACEVDPNDANVQEVAQRMIELMFENKGVGLAAPQVGLPWRIFVTQDLDNEGEGIVWMNPELETIDDTPELEEEGCLSLPDIRADIRRPIGVRISGFDGMGQPHLSESSDFIARVWQHENDHLDGVLIIDKMSAMDRLVNRKLIKHLERLAK
ncbi:MAG: peptide deformylase [Phycisphaerales bacterium]|nr:peptide deformylase [Phycisphaerales bacterium]